MSHRVNKYEIGDVVNQRKWFNKRDPGYNKIERYGLVIVDIKINEGKAYYKVSDDSSVYYGEDWFCESNTREVIETML